MSISTIGSPNPYSRLMWASQSGVDGTDTSGPPSDPLVALFNAFTGGGSGPSDPLRSPSDDSSSGGLPPFSTDMMSTMISMLGGSNDASAPLQSLIGKFDTDGDGNISQSEFEQAMGPNADKGTADQLFSKINANGDGTISQDELGSAIQKAHGHRHHHGGGQTEQAGGSQGTGQSTDSLAALLAGQQADGSTSQSTTNADGSTTTTITYADGTTIDMTTPAASNDGSSQTASNQNVPSLKTFLEQMINMQARMFALPGTDLSV